MAARKQKHVEEAAFNGNNTFWVETFKTPIIDANGTVLGTVGFASDITERKLVEESLKVAAVVFDSHDAIMITDKQANIIRVNQAFTDITGYPPEEVLGQNPRMMNSGRHDKAFYVEMWQQLQHTGSWSGEIWDKRKDGQIYPKWMAITAVKNDQQETTHYVAIFSDITARQKTEEEIRNLAFYDSLTQLPNRRLFMDRFRAALTTSTRRNDYGALLFIDLDRFKTLNDTLGHDYGEALLRWEHPLRGIILPGEFISIAEEGTLILDIGHWVLDTGCHQLAKWALKPQTSALTLALNVSTKQFAQPNFVPQIKALLLKYKINPALLKLELTESLVLKDLDGMIKKMHEIRSLGVHLSMDDFGTGYSSLSYLKDLPLDQIKIDQGFVQSITSNSSNAMLVQTIIDLAKNFNLNVIAEGVETEAQLTFLKHHDCLAYQGFLFSKAVSIEEFEALLKQV
jgi:PAS domain S-box-containing protein